MEIKFILPVLGLAGFCIAFYIYRKKNAKKVLVCPIGHSCDPVVHSDYSKLCGVPLEILGMLYYLFIVCFYSVLFFTPLSTAFQYLAQGVTASAFVFSMYLIGVQAFILKEWCSWCVISAGLCTAIFSVAYVLM